MKQFNQHWLRIFCHNMILSSFDNPCTYPFFELFRCLKLPKYEKSGDLEVKGFKLTGAVKEQLRPSRTVRVAMIQNTIAAPTSRPIQEQRDALYQKITNYIEHAIACKANIICLQEIWSRQTLMNDFFALQINLIPTIFVKLISSNALHFLHSRKATLD